MSGPSPLWAAPHILYRMCGPCGFYSSKNKCRKIQCGVNISVKWFGFFFCTIQCETPNLPRVRVRVRVNQSNRAVVMCQLERLQSFKPSFCFSANVDDVTVAVNAGRIGSSDGCYISEGNQSCLISYLHLLMKFAHLVTQ